MSLYRFPLILLLLTVAARPQTDTQLTMRSEIERVGYCAVEDTMVVLRIRFKVTLINGQKSTISVSEPLFPVVLVSRTLEDLRNQNLEFRLYPPTPEPLFVSSLEKRNDAVSPRKRDIQSGESAVFETAEITLPVPWWERKRRS
jgi:hypothetical protein